jgi:hypothetical protein
MIKNILKISLFVIYILSILIGCEKDDDNCVKNKSLVPELGYEYDSIVTIESHNYYLYAFLWRDFMPICPPNGHPLISINRLISVDSSAIPNNIKLIKQYVVYEDLVWISQYENETHTIPDYILEGVSRNGPKWGPDVIVEVITKITDIKTNKDYYLKLDSVYILRTE